MSLLNNDCILNICSFLDLSINGINSNIRLINKTFYRESIKLIKILKISNIYSFNYWTNIYEDNINNVEEIIFYDLFKCNLVKYYNLTTITLYKINDSEYDIYNNYYDFSKIINILPNINNFNCYDCSINYLLFDFKYTNIKNIVIKSNLTFRGKILFPLNKKLKKLFLEKIDTLIDLTFEELEELVIFHYDAEYIYTYNRWIYKSNLNLPYILPHNLHICISTTYHNYISNEDFHNNKTYLTEWINIINSFCQYNKSYDGIVVSTNYNLNYITYTIKHNSNYICNICFNQ